MGVTAVDLMDNIIQQYQLTPFNQRRGTLDTSKLIIATATAIYSFDYARLDSPSFTVAVPSLQAISGLTTIPFSTNNLIACITSKGQLHLLDDQGTYLQQQQICQSPLWSISSASVGQRPLLFITAADSTIRVCDTRGELLGTIETPRPVYSLAIKQIGGQTILCGGLQNQNHVCIWNLPAMIQHQDATPMATLSGGRQSAYAATFIETGDSIWLAHSCWDNQLYLYHWPPNYKRKSTHAFLRLKATHPTYSLQAIIVNSNLYLLASTTNGDILAWDITDGKNSEPITVASLGTRVKHMKIFKLGEQWYCFAGSENGHLTIFHVTNLDSLEFITTLRMNGGEIQGIEIV